MAPESPPPSSAEGRRWHHQIRQVLALFVTPLLDLRIRASRLLAPPNQSSYPLIAELVPSNEPGAGLSDLSFSDGSRLIAATGTGTVPAIATTVDGDSKNPYTVTYLPRSHDVRRC